jgi:hypothetical protein
LVFRWTKVRAGLTIIIGMTRWLLNTFPVWVLGVVLVGGFVALGLLFLGFLRRRLPDLVSSEQGVVGANAIVIVIGMYGILLAFVILSLFESFTAAEENAEREASALAQVRRTSRALPSDVRNEMDSRLGKYVRLVVGREWNLMQEGRSSEEAWITIDRLYETLRHYRPQTETEIVFYAEAVAQLDEVVAGRRARVTDAEQGLPTEFLVLVFGGAVLVIGFLCLGGSANPRAHTLFVVGVAALAGFNALLVVTLDHPYSGSVALEPHVFTEGTLAQLP